MSYVIPTFDVWPITIPNATATSDGVMSAAQAALLADLAANAMERIVLSQAQRDLIMLPDPHYPPGTEIFNTDDNAPNYVSGDGLTWRDALGALT